MNCKYCQSPNVIKYGKYKDTQLYYCKDCYSKFKADDTLYHMKTPANQVSSALNMYYNGMTNQAVKMGYITEGQTVSDIPDSKMDDFARDLVRSVGAGRAMKMVNVQINFRANKPDGFKDKMLIAKGAIIRKSKVLKVHTKRSN
jgi:hypothetical protein